MLAEDERGRISAASREQSAAECLSRGGAYVVGKGVAPEQKDCLGEFRLLGDDVFADRWMLEVAIERMH